jgi:NAD(P)-dependent dehydrogenase (short-subunit alcohol dehydrogenase family)
VYLARHGFDVYASMRNPGHRDRLEVEAARRGAELQVLQLDVTDRASITAAVHTVIAQSGSIHGLVNNAGAQLRGYFEDLSDTQVRRLFETNVFGTIAVTRAVLPHMRAAHRGRVVLITSVGGKVGSMALSAYCATKFALEGFGESLALEVAPFGLHVIMIEPAIVKTDIWGRNRGVAEGALSPDSPYYAWFCEFERLSDRMVGSSPTKPIDVAKTVHRAMVAKRPRLRYVVGRRAGLVIALRRYLPGQFFERLYFGEAVRRVTKAG